MDARIYKVQNIISAQFEMSSQQNGYSLIRWHQTADIGYVPNKLMPNTFMAVALDTFDVRRSKFQGGVHPMNKQTPSERLAIAAMNVVYGFKNYRTGGPWPQKIEYGKYSFH